MSARARRELGAVLAFAAFCALALLAKPYHMDEPLFLAPARHIAVDPLHPFAFEFNWYGRSVPMPQINNTPPLMLYALAGAWKLTGGREWAMRLLFVPVGLLAAGALYLLASLFLSAPLWPVLILLACPAYAINMNLLYPETLAFALGLFGLYALVRSNHAGHDRWFWASAGLSAAAVFAKYGAVFLVPTASYYLWKRGAPRRKIALHAAVSLAGISAYILYDRLTYRSALGSAWTVLSQSAAMPYASWPHRVRSILAFTGGCGLATAVWPFWAWRPRKEILIASAGFVVILFLPSLDIAPLVRPIDRATGLLLSFGALTGFWGLFVDARRQKGWPLWAPWILCVLVVQAFLYWSVLARLILFLLPALILAMAEALEQRWSSSKLERLYVPTFAFVLALTAGLAWVDGRYAEAQRGVAAEVSGRHPGRRLWCAGHWGLQYYMEDAGARELDWTRGGWDEVRRGDVVVVPRVNSNVLRPERKLLANVERVTVEEPLPLRLISAFGGEAGFYSSATGFLPFSLSREPLEEFEIVEPLGP
ncbi:MAG: glycosyltransferase family 39 protein [Elusimicrobia bacterium]|nr:glycosyltransferase family 39 protein [Elusimicrobiota bacterium]